MARITKALMSTAYHEAGHAVAAWHVRVRAQKLSIVPDVDSMGRYIHRPYFTGINPEFDNSPRCQRRLENMALVCLAGPAAQRRFNPRGYRHSHTENDYHQALELLHCISNHPDVQKAHFSLLSVQARVFVETPSNWVAIEALAATLLDRKELSGQEIASIIGKASLIQLRMA